LESHRSGDSIRFFSGDVSEEGRDHRETGKREKLSDKVRGEEGGEIVWDFICSGERRCDGKVETGPRIERSRMRNPEIVGKRSVSKRDSPSKTSKEEHDGKGFGGKKGA